MKQYRKASHCVYDLKYHIVWITKYRKPVLGKEIGTRTRELIRMICASLDVEIVKGNISRDHVHLLVSVPPYLAVSKLVQRIKGLTSVVARFVVSGSPALWFQKWPRSFLKSCFHVVFMLFWATTKRECKEIFALPEFNACCA
jgi:putative transposase